MGLASLLPSLRGLDDLPGLVAELGHEPAWEPGPERDWAGARGPVALVGRAGALPWFATEAARPARAARALARNLACRGRAAAVMALSPGDRVIALAVAFGDSPCLALSLDAPDRAALACLDRLRGLVEGGALGKAAQVADALAGEPAGRRFFRQFRAVLERMSAALPPACPAEDRHSLALLQLTRVLFLYLVQSKGWLDGRADFMAQQVDRCLAHGRSLHRHLLHPLFFGTLNRPPGERTHAPRGFGRIPFLNGGLFEPHPLERRWPATLPTPLWRDAFDELFERFRFEAGDGGRAGAIAPDMLGRVFEGVMEPQARRRTGTFYTPAGVVRALVHAALTAHLAQRLKRPEERVERELAERSPRVMRALRGVTLLDPAVGSGAFLLGALEQLAQVEAGDAPAWRARRRILSRSLFGVDLNPAAVRLAELRLWLAVIADDPTDAPERVEPLPNLDCLVRQGDSLLDPLGDWAGVPGCRARPTREAERALAQLRRALVTAVGRDKQRLARELARAEAAAFAGALDTAEASLTARIRATLEEGRGRTLFGDRRGLDAALRRELAGLCTARRALRAARQRFRREGSLPWFHYESHFADVFARGGFDIVIGNPPWVRSERLEPGYRARLAARYRWWRPGADRGFANRPDLALAFLERAWELSAPGGTVALLLPAKIAAAAYGARARHALAGGGTLRAIADFTGSAEAVFDATVYPLALVASKRAPPRGHRVRLALAVREAAMVPQSGLLGGAPWVIGGTGAARAARDVGEGHPRLGDRLACHLGVKTGANDVYLDPEGPLEPELLRWAVRGRDVRPFRAQRAARLLWPCDERGAPLGRLPPLAARYFSAREARLRDRADYAGGPPWAVFRTGAACAPNRVVWADLARRLTALALVGQRGLEQIPLNTCYVAAAPSAGAALRIAAWLNSTWIRAAARLRAVPASGGFARFAAGTVAALPLPVAALDDPALDALARAGAEGADVQEDLDDLVARHLALSGPVREDLATVDGVRAGDRR